jgi:hypothetical protein
LGVGVAEARLSAVPLALDDRATHRLRAAEMDMRRWSINVFVSDI